jgi:pyruvate dehydrogenase E2 component (dihydrolipoamide acetyltransferase)
MLEEFRRQRNAESGTKLTWLPFLIKAAAAALHRFPEINSSLDTTCSTLILKKYYHIGFAVDAPAGLLVPVVRDANVKSILEIGAEIADLVELARTKGLPMTRMSGGSFTISSLGSLGGVGFTPIINAPEVAVLGISRTIRRPADAAGRIEWRTMLPLSLSYDHRAINGSTAGGFCVAFCEALSQGASL